MGTAVTTREPRAAMRPAPARHLLDVSAGSPGVAAVEIRLHAPMHDVVIVRVEGHLDLAGSRLLHERAGYHVVRAAHVIIELLGEHLRDPATTASTFAVVSALRELARHRGSLVHLAADHDGVRSRLTDAGLGHPVHACADEALASVIARSRSGRGTRSDVQAPIRPPRRQGAPP